MLFGLGAKGLQSYAAAEYGLELTPTEAEQYRRRFFQTYPALARWHKREGASSAKECRTLLGRLHASDDLEARLVGELEVRVDRPTLPVAVGVPLISPVLASMVRPAGSPVAV